MSGEKSNLNQALDIRVGEADFTVGVEYERLRLRATAAGAIVLFTGLVRDFNSDGSIQGIVLEHYPAMTLKSLQNIAGRAFAQWPLDGATIIHRIGRLLNQEQIVLVAVAARHRAEAFSAASFIMDYLKMEAPFWKKEVLPSGETAWVESKESDQRARDRW